MQEFVLGLDIGYSNMKLTMGYKDDEPRTVIMPVGAGPLKLMPQQLIGGAATDSCIQVMIDNEQWVAGVEPERLQGWERELHSDYPSTNPYRALFYAALLLSEQKEIDVLVTGLPVDQYMKAELRDALKVRLEGVHQITPKRSVAVKSVIVVPQPAGAYMDVVNSTSDEELLEIIQGGKTIVIDPGFFSVDWVALEEGEVRYHSSGTSLKAMSVLLQETNLLIRADHGGAPGIEKIEKAIRAGKQEIFLYGEKVSITDYFKKASIQVAQSALIPMRSSMREDGMDADVVLLAGGGAEAYREAAKELFPKSRIILPDDSVAANARGFWFCG
ncbi:ParM/StbA family protein [Escherichia coli]|uniref:ParM/StbA family protein n=1 Tax=Edwardsiella TaxID=635 RepID=UPI0014327780|nr:ParM/StbA family protein [Edwardsiella ictaluri]EFP0183612.1 ParM/StbA family protein [Escherichia coli]EGA8339573.1 ParM/StbA family protein [Salmonella enterica subsp. enterica serovar Saintpaul]EKG9744539.1 ParM/StbA family protein [Salmonella enterica]EKS7763301.1 ParM/StbA family protein [Edwardsiella ictaluri]EKS7789716.1 ParM/StbA family protein [Edwardsiella ictaluri]